MFAYLFEKIGNWFDRAEQRRREEHLADSKDLSEVERRIRALEKDGYPII